MGTNTQRWKNMTAEMGEASMEQNLRKGWEWARCGADIGSTGALLPGRLHTRLRVSRNQGNGKQADFKLKMHNHRTLDPHCPLLLLSPSRQQARPSVHSGQNPGFILDSSLSLSSHSQSTNKSSVWFSHTSPSLATFPTSTAPMGTTPASPSFYCWWNKRPGKSP